MDRSLDWFRQPEWDLAVAQGLAEDSYHEWVAFAAKQCAEKAVKALVQSVKGAARGHSITGILEGAREVVEVTCAVMDAARELDQVYLTARYPNGFVSGSPADYFSQTTSQRLIGHARTILEFCRGKIS